MSGLDEAKGVSRVTSRRFFGAASQLTASSLAARQSAHEGELGNQFSLKTEIACALSLRLSKRCRAPEQPPNRAQAGSNLPHVRRSDAPTEHVIESSASGSAHAPAPLVSELAGQTPRHAQATHGRIGAADPPIFLRRLSQDERQGPTCRFIRLVCNRRRNSNRAHESLAFIVTSHCSTAPPDCRGQRACQTPSRLRTPTDKAHFSTTRLLSPVAPSASSVSPPPIGRSRRAIADICLKWRHARRNTAIWTRAIGASGVGMINERSQFAELMITDGNCTSQQTKRLGRIRMKRSKRILPRRRFLAWLLWCASLPICPWTSNESDAESAFDLIVQITPGKRRWLVMVSQIAVISPGESIWSASLLIYQRDIWWRCGRVALAPEWVALGEAGDCDR